MSRIYTSSIIVPSSRPLSSPAVRAIYTIHKKPLLVLSVRLRLLFRFGTTIDPSLLNSLMLPGRHDPLLRTVPAPFSILNAFQPSSSLSSLNALSFSSLNSRSALLALSWLLESLLCSSSIVRSNFSTLSRERLMSSCSAAFVLSRRSICVCRSLTVRSTFRTERCEAERADSWASS